jgi:hypothetical protein
VDIFGLRVMVICSLGRYYTVFPPMRHASAKSQEMKGSFNNNPTRPSNDVMDNPENPENPDSKPMAAARLISIDDFILLNLSFCRCVARFEPIYKYLFLCIR